MGHLTVMLSDVEQFPKLHSLHFKQGSPTKMSVISRLFPGMKDRIKHFSMELYPKQSVSVHCTALSTFWAPTLESIHFGVDAIVSCFDVQLIATSCAGLKKLVIQSDATYYLKQTTDLPEDSLSGWKANFVDEQTGKVDNWICTG